MVIKFGDKGQEFHLDDRWWEVLVSLAEIDKKPVDRYLQKLIQDDYSKVVLNQPKVK